MFAAGCAAEALEILRSLAPPPDVVVTDYQLGRDITGADLISQMRAVLGNEIPAMILSGDAIRAARRCASIPKCKLLQKPVDAAALARYVREAAQQASPTR